MDGATVQKSEPVYEWNNLLDDKTPLHFFMRPEVAGHIKEGRDTISGKPRPGYKPYEYPHPLQKVGEN